MIYENDKNNEFIRIVFSKIICKVISTMSIIRIIYDHCNSCIITLLVIAQNHENFTFLHVMTFHYFKNNGVVLVEVKYIPEEKNLDWISVSM